MFEKQIHKGAELLDRYYRGQDWVLSLDLSNLHLESSSCCVLGQLDGYSEMCGILLDSSGDDGPPGQFGFCLPEEITEGHWVDYSNGVFSMEEMNKRDKIMWDRLTEEWTDFIKDRLDKGVDLDG